MALDKLPNEILVEIAILLPTDRALVNMMLVCKTTRAAIEHPRSSVFPQRFACTYDLPPGLDSGTIWRKYAARHAMLRRVDGAKDFVALKKLRPYVATWLDLIKEAYTDAKDPSHSKNRIVLDDFENRNPFLLKRLQPRGEGRYSYSEFRKFTLAQMTIIHTTLHCHETEAAFSPARSAGWNRSVPRMLRCSFSHPDHHPLIEDDATGRVDIMNLYDITSLFKFVLTGRATQSLSHLFDNIEPVLQPRQWSKPLSNNLEPLDKYWIGIRCDGLCESEVVAVRCSRPDAPGHLDRQMWDWPQPEQLRDRLNFMSLDFEASHQPRWTDDFEFFTESIPIEPLTSLIRQLGRRPEANDVKPTAGEDYLPFVGEISDMGGGLLAGNIHVLPPQDGIPGFRRINFIQYDRPHWSPKYKYPSHIGADRTVDHDSLRDASEQPLPPDHADEVHDPPANLGMVDLDEARAMLFDGLVLPGGKCMVGRWYRCYQENLEVYPEIDEEQAIEFQSCICGPFIYWSYG